MVDNRRRFSCLLFDFGFMYVIHNGRQSSPDLVLYVIVSNVSFIAAELCFSYSVLSYFRWSSLFILTYASFLFSFCFILLMLGKLPDAEASDPRGEIAGRPWTRNFSDV